ncbi:MAG: tyrosine-type recombinase/integrase [Bacteroidetes bacterium]|nr:tyrosine-type recombinase/integrase [Bacteroidota bacterium]
MRQGKDEFVRIERCIFRRTADGKYFTFMKEADGRKHRAQHISLKAARKFRDEMAAERVHSTDATPQTYVRRLTIQQLVDRFLEMKSRTKPKSVDAYRQRLGKLLRFTDERRIRYVDQFTPFHADELHAYLMSPSAVSSTKVLKGRSLANLTVNFHITTIREMFKFSVQLHVIDRNPMDVVPFLDIARAKPKAFTDLEISAFFAMPMPEAYRRVFKALMFSGLRISELCALRWEHIDFRNPDKPVLFVPGTKTEGSRRTIALEPEMLDLLHEIIANPLSDEYPFCNTEGGELNRGPVLKACQRVGKAAGLTGSVHTHRFRHTLAGKLLSKGYPLIKIMRILGQTSPSTTERYCRRVLLGLHDVETAERILNRLVEGETY